MITVVSTLVLGLFANWLAAALSVAAIAFYVLIYTMLLKRRTEQNIVWGGIAGCFPVVIGWAGVTGSLDWPAWILFTLVFLWTPAHYWPLSMKYRDDYQAADVPMLAVVRGKPMVGIQVILYAWASLACTLLLIPVAGAAAPARTVQTAAAVTEPGQGSPTPVPPSASKPLPDEKVAARTDEVAQEVSVGKPTATSSAQMDFPVKGKIIRTYTKGKNEGIDIAASPGAAVTAAKDGSVAAITSSADQVPIVVVRHADNLLTVYANVENIKVKKGDPVSRGQQIAQLRGGSNSYVHFEVRNGFDSVNPMPYLE